MKAPLFAVLVLAIAPASAQLINGSFEDSNGFSLAGWEWTCETPTGGNNVPAGTGQWSVRKNIGSPDCSPSYLYQRIPFAQSGDYWRVGGWVRADEVGWDALPRMGFASVNGGTFTTQSWIGSPAVVWNYCWITDTVYASATDTAVVLLTCGSSFMGAGWYDGIELEPLIPTRIGERTVHLHTYLDEEGGLHVSAGEHSITGAQLIDPAGRMLLAIGRSAGQSPVLRTEMLPTGIYLVRVETDAGATVTRFFKP